MIDAHVHLYPPAINADPVGWAQAHAEPHWATLCTRVRKNGRPVQAFPGLSALLHALDTAGVDRAILLGWYWQTTAACRAHNDFYAACVRAHPDRLMAFATVSPAAGDAALAELRRAADLGLVGLGELSPHSVGLTVHDPRWHAVLAQAEALGWPVNLHVTDSQSPPYPGRVETPLADFWRLAAAFPHLRFILAHWSARGWRTAPSPWPANVWVDTAASPLLYPAEVWREGVAALGPDRILWGTDYPLDLYPRAAKPPPSALAGLLAEARSALTPAECAAVLGGNAARLLVAGGRGGRGGRDKNV